MRVLLLGACLLLSGCGVKGSSNSIVNGAIKVWEKVWPSDCEVEEQIEEAIEDATSLQIDISPMSEEKE